MIDDDRETENFRDGTRVNPRGTEAYLTLALSVEREVETHFSIFVFGAGARGGSTNGGTIP